MREPCWKFAHAVDCGVPRAFAWAYWTNVGNWHDPPARFELDGPFAVGTRLTTVLPDQRLHSMIRETEAGVGALIEMEVLGAVVEFRWRFEEAGEQRTRITQTVSMSGEGAEALLGQAKIFEANLPNGMSKMSRAMERRWEGEKD